MHNMHEVPEFYTGSPIDAADLRYRDQFLDQLWETLQSKHVLLTAPRRTGKTSVMDHLRTLPRDSYSVIYENVQDLAHPADFFAALLSRFYDEHPKIFRDTLGTSWGLITKTLGRIEEFSFSEFKIALRENDPDWKANWKRHGAKFLEQIRHHNTAVLLIVDELPDMILNLGAEDKNLLREFLAWFRAQRQDPQPKHDKVRWLVGGSVNLSGTLDAMQMVDLINDFEDVSLPVLRDEDVKDFVRSMLSGRDVQFDDNVPERFLEHLGRPIPLFMQMVTQDLYRHWKRYKLRLTANDVDVAFDDLVISNAARDKLQHYYSRIARYYELPQRTAAHCLLSQLSLSRNGLNRNRLFQEFERILNEEGLDTPAHRRKQQFNQLLRDLENDFYVSEITVNHYDFASGILKAWWKKYYA